MKNILETINEFGDKLTDSFVESYKGRIGYRECPINSLRENKYNEKEKNEIKLEIKFK